MSGAAVGTMRMTDSTADDANSGANPHGTVLGRRIRGPRRGVGNRPSEWYGHVFFVIYLVQAVVFWRERVLYDTSVFVNTGPLLEGTVFRALDRLSVQIPPQILPLLAVYLGGTTKVAALLYSLNFAAFHYGVWLLLARCYRRTDLGAAFVVCLLVDLVHNNIFIQADLMHAAGYLLLFLATAELPLVSFGGKTLLRAAALMCLALAACFGHPLMAMMTVHFVAYIFIKSMRFDKTLVLSTAIAILMYFVSKATLGMGYEAGALLKTMTFAHLRDSVAVLPTYLARAHWPLILFIAVFALTVATTRRGQMVGLLTLASLAAIGTAICSWIPLDEHHNWQFSGYTWMYFLSLYILLIIPIFDRQFGAANVDEIRYAGKLRAALCVTALVWAVAGSALDFHLSRERQLFIARVRDALVAVKPPIHLLDDDFSTNPLLRENDLTLWDDSLLVSSYDGPDKACMIIPPYSWKNGRGDMYRNRYLQPLNQRYFAIPPAGLENAQYANTKADLETLRQAIRQIEIEYPIRPTRYSYRGGAPQDYRRPLELVYSVPVRFTNNGNLRIPSRLFATGKSEDEPIPVMIGYCWLVEGKNIEEDRDAETLPIDVIDTFTHNIHVSRKGIAAGAELVVGLFVNGEFLPSASLDSWPAPE